MSKNKETLFSEFPQVSEETWKEKVIKDLKGKDFDRLIWDTYEKIKVNPFYTENELSNLKNQIDSLPGEFPYLRGITSKNNDWTINQEISHRNIKQANHLALNAIRGGADSLTFNCEIDESGYAGIPIQNSDDISEMLDGIDIENTEINFKTGTGSIGIFSLFINEAKKREINIEHLSGSIDCDPLGDVVEKGSFSNGEQNSFEELRSIISYLNKNISNFNGLSVSSSEFHNSGASITQELACTLASGVEYLNRLTEMDLSVDQITKHMTFSFSVGSNYFMEIAKLRAARFLWAEIIKQYEPKDESSMIMDIKVTNSSWNKTVYDPYVNLLRGTVETMAGALGGASSITVRPLDSEYETPGEFSLRMSRNTQLVLKNESYLERVADPSAGSYYIENLTNSIAQESWKLFQQIEENGGFVESLKSGFIQSEIEETQKLRDMNIASRKDIFLGVNQYPNPTEKILSDIQNSPSKIKLELSGNALEKDQKLSIEQATEYLSAEGTYVGDLNIKSEEKEDLQITPLTPYRGAQIFEDIRIATEKHKEKTGYLPVVFLLTIGNPSMRSARATFSGNFFGCAGYEIINNIGFNSAKDGVESAIKNKADVVAICSSDAEYTEFAPEIITSLREQGSKAKVVIAGNPKEHIDELKEAGVDDFIHMRSNALEILTKYQKILGIS